MAKGVGGFSNIAQWRNGMRAIGINTKQTIRQALPAIARHMRDSIRSRVPPGSASGNFPGYASTGGLQRAIVAGPVRDTGKRFSATVGLSSRANRITKIKAYVHENGMTIHAKRYKYMTFRIGGKWIKARQVRIRAKHFFRDGYAEGRANFPATLNRYMRLNWPPKR